MQSKVPQITYKFCIISAAAHISFIASRNSLADGI